MRVVQWKFHAMVLASFVTLASTGPNVVAKSDGTKDVPQRAEYAVRWNPGTGGPRTAAEVFKLLDRESDEEKSYKITYYQVPRPANAPEGFDPILRQRARTDGNIELTYKLRGAVPFPPSLKNWPCPLPDGENPKWEVDVSFTGPDDSKKAFSVSCDAELKSALMPFLHSLYADKRGCTATMRRIKQSDYTVELWTVGTDRTVIEVSMKGEDTPDSRLQFRQTVDKLVKAGIQPLSDGMTETVMRSCS